MGRIEKPDIATIRTPYGPIHPSGELVPVGDFALPRQMEVIWPGADGQPRLEALIEVIDGVPRLTEWQLKRVDGGREIRQRDLRAIQLDEFVETIVAVCSYRITFFDPETGQLSAVKDNQTVPDAVKDVASSRKGSRRPMTDDRKQRVADVYNAHESGGIEAVENGFRVSRSTAIRYINAARDAGLIEKRAK